MILNIQPRQNTMEVYSPATDFGAYNLLRGIPLNEIMRASGHTSYSSFQKYWCYYD